MGDNRDIDCRTLGGVIRHGIGVLKMDRRADAGLVPDGEIADPGSEHERTPSFVMAVEQEDDIGVLAGVDGEERRYVGVEHLRFEAQPAPEHDTVANAQLDRHGIAPAAPHGVNDDRGFAELSVLHQDLADAAIELRNVLVADRNQQPARERLCAPARLCPRRVVEIRSCAGR